jgi:osmotically inducible lipoprotein OsmB
MKFIYSSLVILLLAITAGCFSPAGRGAVRGAATGASISAIAGGDAAVGAAVGGAVGATTNAMRANRYRRHFRW